MKKPKIILDGAKNTNERQEAINEMLAIKKEGKLSEYGQDFYFKKGYKELKAGDIVEVIAKNVTYFFKIKWTALMDSGDQKGHMAFYDVVAKGE